MWKKQKKNRCLLIFVRHCNYLLLVTLYLKQSWCLRGIILHQLASRPPSCHKNCHCPLDFMLHHYFTCLCLVVNVCCAGDIYKGTNFISDYLSKHSSSYDTVLERLSSPASLLDIHQRGVDAYMRQEHSVAQEIFERVVASDSSHSDALFYLGLIHKQYGHFQRAGELYAAALVHNPLHFKAHLNFATLHHSFGNVEEAIRQYK